MHGVATRDVRALLDVAIAIEYDPRRSTFAHEGLTALCELVEADWVTYTEWPRGARHTVKSEVETRPFVGHNDEQEAIFWALHHEYALVRAPAPEDGVLLIGDVATDRAWRRTAFYNEWCREVHIEPQAKVFLSAVGSPVGRSLIFDLADDAGRSFGHRERTLLRLIRPAFVRPIALAETVRERHRALGLTPRELEVLGLVRDGMTNSEDRNGAVRLAWHDTLAPRERLREDRRAYAHRGHRAARRNRSAVLGWAFPRSAQESVRRIAPPTGGEMTD